MSENDTNRLPLYIEIATIYKDMNKTAMSKQYALQAEILARKVNHDYYLLSASRLIAELSVLTGENNTAELLCSNIYNMLDTADYLNNETRFNKELALTYIAHTNVSVKKGNISTALWFGLKALEISEYINDDVFMANANQLIGSLFITINDFERALGYFNKSLELIMPKRGYAHEKAVTYNAIGAIYFYLGEYTKAKENYKRSLDIAIQANDSLTISVTYGNIAEVDYSEKNFSQAIKSYNMAIEIQEQLSYKSGLTFLYYGIAETYMQFSNYLKAISYFNKSLNLALETRNNSERVNIYKKISKAYADMNDFEKSYFFLLQYASLKDSIHNDSRMKQINELETRYQSEKKEHQIVLQSIQLEKNKLQKKAMLIMLVALFIILSIIFAGYYNISKQNKNIQRINQEIEAKNNEITTQAGKLEQANESLNITLKRLKETQSQLIHSEKMASLGILASGVAHEINNPLNYIAGGCQVLEHHFQKRKDNLEEEILFSLSGIKKGIEKATEIVKRLSRFSASSNISVEYCDINAILENCLEMLQHITRNRISIERQYMDELIISGNAADLHQVFLNILMNAIQAIDESGNISIITKKRDAHAFIEISDDGCGIDPQNLQRIKDPFFTTKDPDKGIGLGLSISNTIIQEHKGNLIFESELGKGTRTIITLPVKTKQ